MNKYLLFLLMLLAALPASASTLVNYSGSINVDGSPYTGTGYFKMAIVNASGATIWSNDGTSASGSEPSGEFETSVEDGAFSVYIGDDALMNAFDPSIFNSDDELALRIWFDDGSNGSTMLSPDIRISSAIYAIQAETLQGYEPDDFLKVSDTGSVTTSSLADNAVTASKADFFGDSGRTFKVGGASDGNVRIEADLGGASDPTIRYNAAADQWELSNDGTSFSAISTGASLGATDLGDITSVLAGSGLSGGSLSGAATLTVNQAFVPTWTGAHTFMTDVNMTFGGTENLAVTSDLAGSVDMVSVIGTPSAIAGIARGVVVQQANSANTNGLDTALLIDNADTDLTVATAFQVTSAAGGITTAVDLSDPEIVTAFAIGNNDITVGGVTISAAELATLDGGGAGITALTGEVTATGPGSVAATIADDVINFTEIADVLTLDAPFNLSQGTNGWSQNFDGTNSVGFTFNAPLLDAGTGMRINGPTSGGTTDMLINASSYLGNSGILMQLTASGNAGAAEPTTSFLNTIYNEYNAADSSVRAVVNQVFDAQPFANSNYGFWGIIENTGANAAGTKEAYGMKQEVSAIGSTGGTTNVYGAHIQTTATHAIDAGTLNNYGVYIANGTSSTDGDSTKYGLYVSPMAGADNNYGAYFGSSVGIGTLTPASELDVNGTIRAQEICDESGAHCQVISAGWASSDNLDGDGLIDDDGTLDVDAGNGLRVFGDEVQLGNLTANWSQGGAFDIILGNAASELIMLESVGATFYGAIDVGNLSANRTYTFPDETGTVLLSGSALDASNLTVGTVDDARLSANVSLLGASIESAEITDDTVALTTDTAGNYVASVGTGFGSGLSGGAAGSEGATLALSVDQANPFVWTANHTFSGAGPSLIFDATEASDTDYWIGSFTDSQGDDDDGFYIGTGTNPGNNTVMSVQYGNFGLGDNAYAAYQLAVSQDQAGDNYGGLRVLSSGDTAVADATVVGASISNTGDNSDGGNKTGLNVDNTGAMVTDGAGDNAILTGLNVTQTSDHTGVPGNFVAVTGLSVTNNGDTVGGSIASHQGLSVYNAGNTNSTQSYGINLTQDADTGTTFNWGMNIDMDGSTTTGPSIGFSLDNSTTTTSGAKYGTYVRNFGDSGANYVYWGSSSGEVTAESAGLHITNATSNSTTDGITKYGIYVTTPGAFAFQGGGGAPTSNYGLYVEAAVGADQNYTAYFATNGGIGVGIGDTTPDTELKVVGALCVKNDANNCAGSDDGTIYANNTTVQNADYAEYFQAEDDAEQGDVVGLNPVTGLARAYQPGDTLLGIVSTDPGVVGNADIQGEASIIVALMGQVPFNEDQVVVEGNRVLTPDGQQIGYLLADGNVYLNVSSNLDRRDRAEIDDLRRENDDMKRRLERLEELLR